MENSKLEQKHLDAIRNVVQIEAYNSSIGNHWIPNDEATATLSASITIEHMKNFRDWIVPYKRQEFAKAALVGGEEGKEIFKNVINLTTEELIQLYFESLSKRAENKK